MTISTIKYNRINYKSLNANKPIGLFAPSRTQKTITAFGNAQLSTDQYKSAPTSIKFDGAGDYLKCLDFNDYTAMLNSDFTIECWLWVNQLPSTQTGGGGSYMTLWFSQTATGTSIEPYILLKNNASNYPVIDYGLSNLTSGAIYGSFSSYTGSTITLNTWHHFALTRKANVWNAWWNGNNMGPNSGTTATTQYPIISRFNLAGWPQTGRGYWNGYIDEFRISWSSRYGSNFTPQSSFDHDDLTMMLLKFDGSNASTTIIDSIS